MFVGSWWNLILSHTHAKWCIVYASLTAAHFYVTWHAVTDNSIVPLSFSGRHTNHLINWIHNVAFKLFHYFVILIDSERALQSAFMTIFRCNRGDDVALHLPWVDPYEVWQNRTKAFRMQRCCTKFINVHWESLCNKLLQHKMNLQWFDCIES